MKDEEEVRAMLRDAKESYKYCWYSKLDFWRGFIEALEVVLEGDLNVIRKLAEEY